MLLRRGTTKYLFAEKLIENSNKGSSQHLQNGLGSSESYCGFLVFPLGHPRWFLERKGVITGLRKRFAGFPSFGTRR